MCASSCDPECVFPRPFPSGPPCNGVNCSLNTGITNMQMTCITTECQGTKTFCASGPDPNGDRPVSGPFDCKVLCDAASACMTFELHCENQPGKCILDCNVGNACPSTLVQCGPNECRVDGCNLSGNVVTINRNESCAVIVDGVEVGDGPVGSCVVQ